MTFAFPKTSSRSRVKKGPVRSAKHTKALHEEPCIVCGRSPVETHHARVGDRTMGVRKSDLRQVPLCAPHHAELHRGKEEIFWARHGVDPLAWCRAYVGKVDI